MWPFFDIQLQLIHSLEIKGDASLAAINLEAVKVLAARGKAGRLDAAYSAVLESHKRKRRVVHIHRSQSTCSRQGSLRNEGLQQSRDLGDLTDEITCQV